MRHTFYNHNRHIRKLTTLFFVLSLFPLHASGTGMYVANRNSNTVNIIDTTNQTIAGTVTIAGPISLARAGTAMYVGEFITQNISIIDTTNQTIAGTVGVGSLPLALALSGTGMYVANRLSDNVNIIDTTTQTIAGTVTVGSRPGALALAGTGMYVANNNDDNVNVIDITTNTVVGSVTVGAFPSALALAGTGMYVCNLNANNVNIIDITSQTVAGTVNVGVSPDALALAGTGMYVANRDINTVSIIDTTSHTVVGTVPVNSPVALALAGTGMYVANNTNDVVYVIDITTNTVVGSVTAGGYPMALALDVSVPPPPPPFEILTTNLSGNAKKTANYINASGDPALLTWFSSLSSQETLDALNATCGSRNHAVFFSSEFALQTAGRSLLGHIRQAQNVYSFERSSPSTTSMLVRAGKTIPCHTEKKEPRLSLWALNTAEYAHLKASPNNNPALGFFSDTTLLGLDYQTPQRQLVGGMLGYSHVHNHTQNNSGHSKSNLYMASLYADLFWDHFYLSPGVIGAFDNTSQMRRVKFTEFDAKASSKLFAWLIDPHLELGYEIVCKKAVMAPFTLLDWTFAWQRDYREQGAAPFNEKAPSQQGSLLRSETGLRSFQHICYSWGDLFFTEKASYVFLKPFSAGNIQTGFTGAPGNFSIVYADHPLNLGALGFDASLLFGKKHPTQLKLGFEGEAGSRYWSCEATLEIAQKF